ncbi:MAG: aldose 1-epimerase family protein [Anaerolineales bacterium]
MNGSREHLEQHLTDLRGLIDARESTLPDGQRQIDVYNSSGLRFTILPDRGMDIWTAWYKELPLTWVSAGAPHRADFGSPWLRQFNGGLLTTCGLQHAGPAERDSVSGDVRDVHGNFTRLAARDVAINKGWQADRYTLEIRGTLYESALFGAQWRLERRYQVTLGEPAITLSDHVTNLATKPAPLMLLYHVNLGYPLIRAGSRLSVASEAVYPRDAAAEKGAATWEIYEAPSPHYAEQVFFHHVKTSETGWSTVALTNDDFGLALSWDARSAPYFTQWKNTHQGIYVCGIEPGNCLPEGQNAARAAGRLAWLAPGERQSFTCQISAFEEPTAVQHQIMGLTTANTWCKLEDFG